MYELPDFSVEKQWVIKTVYLNSSFTKVLICLVLLCISIYEKDQKNDSTNVTKFFWKTTLSIKPQGTLVQTIINVFIGCRVQLQVKSQVSQVQFQVNSQVK